MATKNLKAFIVWGQKGLTGLTGGLKGLKTNLRESALQAQALNVQLKKVDSGLAKMQKTIAMIGVAGAAGFGLILKEGLSVVAVFEEINLALEVMLKSRSAAEELMRDVTKFAATTPFELKEVAEGAKQLLAFRADRTGS